MSCHFLFIGPLASRVVPLWWPQYLLLIVFDAFISFQFDFLECHNPLISRLSISISVVQMGKIRSNKTFYMLFATATPWLPAQLIWGLFCLLLFKLKVNLIRQDDLSCFEILGIFQLAVNERRSERKGNDINQSLTPESWTTLFCYYPFSNHFQSLYISQLRVHERRFQTGSSLIATVALSAQYSSRDAYEGLQLTCASQPHPFQVREPNSSNYRSTSKNSAQSCVVLHVQGELGTSTSFLLTYWSRWERSLRLHCCKGTDCPWLQRLGRTSTDKIRGMLCARDKGSPVGLHLPAQPARKHSKAPAASTLCRTVAELRFQVRNPFCAMRSLQVMECFPILLCVVRLKQVHDAEEADLRKELASIEADAGFASSRCCNSKSDATGIEQQQSYLSESWQVFQDKFSLWKIPYWIPLWARLGRGVVWGIPLMQVWAGGGGCWERPPPPPLRVPMQHLSQVKYIISETIQNVGLTKRSPALSALLHISHLNRSIQGHCSDIIMILVTCHMSWQHDEHMRPHFNNHKV